MFCGDNFILTVRIKAKAGSEDELRSVLENAVCKCAGQEGLLLYSLHNDREDPGLFMLYEHFTSEASYRMHMDSEIIRSTYDAIVHLIEDGPEIRFWTMLEKTGV